MEQAMTIFQNSNSITRRRGQSGAVLIVSLVILLIITMFAVGSMQNTILEEKMAGNASDRNLAFQSTESAIREAEEFVRSIVSLGNFGNGGGLRGRTADEPSYLDATTWTDANNHIVAQTNFGSYENPRYYVKHVTTVSGIEGSLNMSGYGDNKGTGDTTIFRITARGTGASADSAEVILRSQFGRIF